MKTERIFREILIGVLEGKERFFQKEISQKCEISIGLVNKTIKKLELAGSLQIFKRGFSIIDPNKILLYWATRRNIQKEASGYYVKTSIEQIEKTLPSPVIFTAFSGWKLLKKRTPADYREIYVYVYENERKMIEEWLKEKKPAKGPPNLFIIFTKDKHLVKNSKNNIAPLPQIFVDIYSISSMMGKYFLNDILEEYPQLRFGV